MALYKLYAILLIWSTPQKMSYSHHALITRLLLSAIRTGPLMMQFSSKSFSGYGTAPPATGRPRAAGMNFYFTKPVSPGRLAEALAGLAAP